MRRNLSILFVLVALAVFVVCNTTVRGICAEASYPFRRVAGWISAQLSDRFDAAWRGFCDGASVAQTADELERLRVMLNEASRTAQENAELRAALGWKDQRPERVVAAPVWSHGGGLGVWPRLTLGVGSQQGVAAGDAVVAPEGLIGRVAEGVSPHLCEVVLISDPACRVAAEIPGVTKGILFGEAGEDFGEHPEESLLYTAQPLTFRFLRKAEGVTQRQQVLTEGSGGIFPRGVPIGHVLQVKQAEGSLISEALIEPAADPALLRTVFVLTHEPSSAGAADAH